MCSRHPFGGCLFDEASSQQKDANKKNKATQFPKQHYVKELQSL